MNSTFLLGLAASASTWVLWASAVVLFRKAGDRLSPVELNFGKNVVGLLLFALLIPFMEPKPWEISLEALSNLALSGALGIALGDLLFMASLVLLGASLNAIVGSTYTPVLIVTSILFLGEAPGPGIWLGGAMVVGAIVLSSWEPGVRLERARWVGVLYGLSAVLAMAAGIVIMKPYLDAFPSTLVNLIRMGAGVVVLFAYILWKERGSLGFLRFFTSHHFLKYLLPGSVLGAFLAIWTWTVSLAYLPASLVGVLGQITTFAIIFAAHLFLGERITMRKVVAALIAVTGSSIAILWK